MLEETLDKNKDKGITLIALVVTIIVLLILAGISISMLTGQNGILTRVAEAKRKTEDAEKQENEKMQRYEQTIDERDLPETAEGQAKGTQIKSPVEYSNKVKAIADGNGNYFPLPEGAEYREEGVVNKVNENDNVGVVVYIKESEFVWVPVEDAVLDKTDATKMANLPRQASEWKGKVSYTPMAVKVGENYKGILYNFSGNSAYLKYNNSANNYLGGLSDYREPDSVVSSMIWGSQYDAMMNWMAKNGTSVGNTISGYNNTTKTGGSKDTDVINNIYDLYGCHFEWTLEACNKVNRSLRGGYSGDSSSPAYRISSSPNLAPSSTSSRATLYIK